jgi:hypothetical protein
MNRIILLITYFLFIVPVIALAQDNGVDSKNKSIYTYYTKTDNVNIQVSTVQPLTVSRVFQTGPAHHYVLNDAAHTPTVDKFFGYSIAVAMLNSGSEDYLDFKKLRPGFQLKLGFQCYIDTIFYRLNTRYGANSWGFNVTYKLDNLDVYDSGTNLEQTRYPSSYGLESYFNWFLPVSQNAKCHKVIALTAAYNHTWNDDDLLNYQNISEATVTSNVVAFKDFRGRYGVLQTNISNLRFSAAMPFYVNHFNPIPFVVYNSYSNNQWDYHLGLFMNLLAQVVPPTNFKIPSAFGLGVDWVHTGSSFSSANLILKGTLAL